MNIWLRIIRSLSRQQRLLLYVQVAMIRRHKTFVDIGHPYGISAWALNGACRGAHHMSAKMQWVLERELGIDLSPFLKSLDK